MYGDYGNCVPLLRNKLVINQKSWKAHNNRNNVYPWFNLNKAYIRTKKERMNYMHIRAKLSLKIIFQFDYFTLLITLNSSKYWYIITIS